MASEMVSYLYFFVDAEYSAFKVGVSSNPFRRIFSLPEKIDLDKSVQFTCRKSDVFRIEKTIHFLFSEDRLVKPIGDGYTEWFPITAFAKIFTFIIKNQDKLKWLSYGPICPPADKASLAIEPTGDLWKPTPENPATVPFPLSLIITSIEGNYTEQDRKLYAFLIHATWNEIGKTRTHELRVSRINKVFRSVGGQDSPNWIWDSAKRLAEIPVTLEENGGKDNLEGMTSLLSYAATHEEARADGVLRFEFPAGLIPVLKEPRRFARLRINFLMALSGKYAVTLYEILESVANMRNPVLEIELSQLRQWLKVPEGKIDRYVDLKRFVLEPGIKQINENPEGAGFSVRMEAIKNSKAVERIRFTVQKVDTRMVMEEQLKPRTEPVPEVEVMGGFGIVLSTRAYEKAKKAAPGLDIYALEAEWRDWIKGKPLPNDPEAAFVGFCRKRQRRMEAVA